MTADDAAAPARALLRRQRSGALATALADDAGRPYASLVTCACDCDGSPILLFSALSDHTRNLAADGRASLLLEDAGRRANPQTGPRLSLIGRIAPDPEPRLRRRFLARHPKAALYVDFPDFRIFRMSVERCHWVGGFARARWISADSLLADASAAAVIADAEPSVLEHMNADHGDAIDLYAARLLRRAGSGWRMIAIDPEGCDLARGASIARLTFPTAAPDLQGLRTMLVELAAQARALSGGPA
jgi:heme iron utilization protein